MPSNRGFPPARIYLGTGTYAFFDTCRPLRTSAPRRDLTCKASRQQTHWLTAMNASNALPAGAFTWLIRRQEKCGWRRHRTTNQRTRMGECQG